MAKNILNKIAPDFVLPDQFGKMHKLSDYRGKWVLLYFYPKDMTPGCTDEACAFRDSKNQISSAGLVILGVSVDSVASHEKFYKKYNLNFPLLSDEKKEVVKKYGVWGKKKFMGHEYEGTMRESFLINPEGKIEKIYQDVKPSRYAEEVLESFE